MKLSIPIRVMLIFGPVLCMGAPLAPAIAFAQGHGRSDRYDETFRKYSKRYFGPAYDWREFKAQGLAESNLDSTAHSGVGARGVMQLMPTTFREIATHNPEIHRVINDPEWNIAAGISYDRRLWCQWESDSVTLHRREFMFASYNAGRGTILGAQAAARARNLDARLWPNIEQVAPNVPRWRYRETLGYVHKIDGHLSKLDDRGRLIVTPP
jgi:membrane-bound lytic murein transglycosylase F